MLPGHTNGNHLNHLAAIRHDESLTDLLRIHLAEPDIGIDADESAPRELIPALLGAYLALDSVRHDFPVVLADRQTDTPAVPLSSLIDTALEKVAATGTEAENLRRYACRIEALIKQLAESKPRRRLSVLWMLAAEQLEKQSDNLDRVRAGLDTIRAQLIDDGLLVFCDSGTSRRIFEHTWGQLQSERARDERVVLEEVIGRLSEVLESERARSPKSDSPEALEAALGGEHAGGIDFEALSTLLRSTRRSRVAPAKRVKRLRVARKVLNSQLALLPGAASNGKRRRRTPQRASVCTSCAEAMALFEADLRRQVDMFGALRMAKLELDNHYREERHDHYFETFGPAQFTTEEYRAAPPLLVFLKGDTLSDAEQSMLAKILGSDMPVKVVLEVQQLPVSDDASAPPGTFTEWTRQIARMAISMGEVFVMQTAASHLPQLAPQIVAGLRRNGPALFCIYTAPEQPRGAVPPYLRCASAVESRAFPSFVYDPDRGADWASRFSLAGSPQIEQAWPTHAFAYETSQGRAASQTLDFTCIDFLMLDPRFSHHFVQVPASRWHANMVPMAQYLELPRAETLDKVPYVYMLGPEDRVYRLVVKRGLVAFARKCLTAWRGLQALSRIGDSHVLPLAEQEPAQRDEEQAAGSSVPGEPCATDSGPADAAPPPPAEAAGSEPAAEPPDSGQAYVDTDMCTTCDDCTDRNPAMFAYNEEKQAYIKDITAGSYRELVEAAENCPVCIIHPGKPHDPSEPGLEDLQKRAAAFS